jgi:hypothetical protein
MNIHSYEYTYVYPTYIHEVGHQERIVVDRDIVSH